MKENRRSGDGKGLSLLSQDMYRRIVENLTEGIISLDAQARISFVNQHMATSLGYTIEEMLGQKFESFLAEDQISDHRIQMKIRALGTDATYERCFVKKDDGKHWAQISAKSLVNPEGRFEGSFAVVTDINERMHFEAQLLEQEFQYRTLANSGKALIWTAGTDKLCNYFNDPWLKFTGRTLEQEMGNGWAEGVHPDDFDSCLKTYLDAFDRREPFEMEYRLHHVSGEYRWLLDLGTPNYNSKGEFLGYIGHCFDIDDRKRAEHQLNERMKELKAFYTLTELTEKEEVTPESLYREFISLLPESWQYPEIACSRIVVQDLEYRTENYRDSSWKLSAPIHVNGSVVGRIEIAYLQEKPNEDEGPFLKEERKLINALAERLGLIIEREWVQEALRISEGRFRNYFELPLTGRAITSPEKGWLDVNDTLCNMLGYPKDELMRMTWAELTHPDDIAPDMALFNQVMAGEINGYSINKRFIRKDGRIVHTHLAVQCLRNLDGSVDSFVAILLDISDLKKAEEALEEINRKLQLSENELKKAQSVARLGNWKWNIKTGEVTWSDEMFRIFRIDKNSYTGRLGDVIANVIHPDDLYLVLPSNAEEFAAKKPIEYRIILPDQSIRHIIAEAGENITDKDGNTVFLTGVAQDITERKRAEELLRQSEEKYRLISESTSDVIWKMNVETLAYTYISPSVIHLTGFTVEEAMRQSVQEALSPESAAVVMAELPVRIGNFYSGDGSQKSVEFELQQLCKNGTYIWVDISATFILNSEGKITEIIGVSRNIDQRKHSDLLIQEQNLRLKELVAEKDKFFSIIAHDLRAPFNSFLGFTRMMVEDLPTLRLDEIQKIALTMRDSATSLYCLLENLLEWATIQRGVAGFDPKPVLLMAFIEESVQSVMESAHKKGIGIGFTVPANLMVFADGNMLGSTIRNLVSNAVKFTSQGGKITLTAKPVEGNSIEIAIRDTGIGMNQEILENLFSLDENVSRPGTLGEPSSGLGLIICKDCVEKHGGKIWAESEEGKGSTFYFTLPAN